MPRGLRAPDFELRDQDGEPISMRSLRGKPVVVTFLYTHCEDTCPAQAQTVRGALDQLGHDVPAIAVAVDPPRDTEASARAFLSKQRVLGRIDFVLGARKELRPIWNGFHIAAQSVAQRASGALHARRRPRLPARRLPGLRGDPRGRWHTTCASSSAKAAGRPSRFRTGTAYPTSEVGIRR